MDAFYLDELICEYEVLFRGEGAFFVAPSVDVEHFSDMSSEGISTDRRLQNWVDHSR